MKKQKENFDYAACAQEIFQKVGGRENLRRVTHCATRLRLVTVDDTRADRRALERIEGVKGVFVSGGQLQIIIGPGAVNKVFDEFLKVSGMDDSGQEEVKRVGREKQPLSVSRVLQAIGEVFVPLLPAIVSAGLISGIMELLAKLSPGFAARDWYAILDLFANTAFQFLPVLIAISAATIFGGNRFMAAVIGLIMVHPDLLNAWTAAEMDASQIPQWHVLGLTIRQVGYQSHVIPILIVIWLMSRIEKTLHRHVPESADLFITPLCTILPTAFLALGVIGPVFASAESYMLEFAQWLITVGYGVGSMIMGAIYPLTVVCGVHHMYNVIEAGMLAGHNGTNTWMPIASAANFAQGAACLAVGLNKKRKNEVCGNRVGIFRNAWYHGAGDFWYQPAPAAPVYLCDGRRCSRCAAWCIASYWRDLLWRERSAGLSDHSGLYVAVCADARGDVCSDVRSDMGDVEGSTAGKRCGNGQ